MSVSGCAATSRLAVAQLLVNSRCRASADVCDVDGRARRRRFVSSHRNCLARLICRVVVLSWPCRFDVNKPRITSGPARKVWLFSGEKRRLKSVTLHLD